MSQSKSSSGVGLMGLLGILFIGLKLGNVITWSWWWVLAPFWLPAFVVLFVVASMFLIATVADVIRDRM